MLWPVLAPSFAMPVAGDAPAPLPPPAPSQPAIGAEVGMPADEAGTLLRLVRDWRPTGLPPPVQALRLAVGAGLVQEAPEYSWVGLAARLVGTIVHAELQRLAAQRELPRPEALRAADYLPRLAELGLAGEPARSASQRIVAALAGTLADARGRWLLGEGGGESRSELRLAGLHEGLSLIHI